MMMEEKGVFAVAKKMGLWESVHIHVYYRAKGTLPNYFLKISVIMTLSLGPPPLSVMAKVADSHTWT